MKSMSKERQMLTHNWTDIFTANSFLIYNMPSVPMILTPQQEHQGLLQWHGALFSSQLHVFWFGSSNPAISSLRRTPPSQNWNSLLHLPWKHSNNSISFIKFWFTMIQGAIYLPLSLILSIYYDIFEDGVHFI